MPAVEWSDREDADLATLEAMGPEAGEAYVAACDRFVSRYPDSAHAVKVALGAARAVHRAKPVAAFARLVAVLGDPRASPEVCGATSKLLASIPIACATGLMEEIEATHCALQARTERREPVVSAPGVADAQLDQLGFLSGCFQSWTMAWGLRTCWRRDGAVWRGTADWYGDGEPAFHANLTLARGGDGVTVDVESTGDAWMFRGVKHARAAVITDEQIVFLTANGPFELRRDGYGLIVSRDLIANRMGRVSAR